MNPKNHININGKGANELMHDLMVYYGAKTPAEVFSQGLKALKTAAFIYKNQGKIYARRGDQETELIF